MKLPRRITLALCAMLSCSLMFLPVNGQRSRRRRPPARERADKTPEVHFTSGSSALGIPFDLYDNGIFLKAQVNKSRPLTFSVDTGAGIVGVITARTAESLGLKPRGKYRTGAVGGDIQFSSLSGVSISLPGIELLNQKIAVLPFDNSSDDGPEVEGALGHDFLKQFVVEIDYAAGVINLYDPASYQYSGAGEIVPIEIVDSSPMMRVEMTTDQGRVVEGRFIVDTGLSGTLVYHAAFVKRTHLLSGMKTIQAAVSDETGGEYRRSIGRAKSLQFGRVVIEHPVVSFSIAGDPGGESEMDGVIGTEIFRRFKLILDYTRRRIIFEPNAHLADPYEEDMSGLALVPIGKGDAKLFKVQQVLANTPAAEAGLRAGDLITAIDGTPASGFTMNQLGKLFVQDGREVSFSLKRGRKPMETKLRLRRLI
jgi:predicted aspartyl protease